MYRFQKCMLLTTLALVAVATAQTPAPDLPVPDKQKEAPKEVKYPTCVVKEPVHDFGEVWAGTVLEHSFEITNTGDAPLEILKVKPKCGCTVSGKYDKVVRVGQVSTLPFKLKTNRYNGRITKHITVTTNDPKKTSLKLTLVATVKPFVQMDPRNGAAFSNMQEEETQTRTVRLKNNTDKPIKLSLVPYNAESPFTVELKEIVEGQEFDLVVMAAPPYRSKQNRRPIKLKTDIPDLPELQVNCWANIVPRIDVSPSVLTIRADMPRSIPRHITIFNRGETHVHVKSVETDMPDLDKDMLLQESDPGRQYDLTITIPKDYNPEKLRGTLTILTDDEKKPTIEIPIQVHKRKKSTRTAVTPDKELKSYIGKPMPTFVGTTEGGETISSAVLDGSILLLDFFTSDTVISKLQLPQVDKLYGEHFNSKVKVLGICQDAVKTDAKETKAKAATLLKTQQCRFDWIFDPDRTIGDSLPLKVYPTLILVDPHGTIRGVWTGAPKRMEQEVEYIIAAIQRQESASTRTPPKTAKPVMKNQKPQKQDFQKAPATKPKPTKE